MGGYASCPPSGGQGHSDTTGGIPNGLYHLMFMHSLVQQKRAWAKLVDRCPKFTIRMQTQPVPYYE
jgi:hypothetical protein